MITNTGKNILSKFLISQAPAYASYIAIGCGQKPLSSTPYPGDAFGDYSDQTNMEFEMLRLPIVSRGYIKDDDDLEKIVFTEELPTEERYEITEVGVYSAGGNPSAVGFDSRMLYTFSENEGWEYIDAASELDSEILLETNLSSGSNIIDTTKPAFFFTSTNLLFANANRVDRYERPRILNGSLAIVGDTATLSTPDLEMTPGVGSDYLRLTGTSVNFNKNAPTDILKMAFSIMNKNGDQPSEIPDNVQILLQFASSSNPGTYANFQVDLANGTGEGQHDFATNRYVVVSKTLQELFYRPGFSWGVIDEIRIYTSVTDSASVSDNYYVAFDGIRIENVSTQNPLYGLTGYTVMKTTDGQTVVKNQNTKNYIEFRFAIDVGVV